jgi:pyridoxamine 5'-phosphate oxidase
VLASTVSRDHAGTIINVNSGPIDLAQMRNDYARASLDIADVDRNPIVQFERWLAAAIDAKLPEPSAMTLATADAAGRPSARIVLLKGCDERGFVFFTNYLSRKGKEIAANTHVALLFHWVELERTVRIEGIAAATSEAESAAYFASRPRGSRVSAAVSAQSEVVPDRAFLEEQFRTMDAATPEPFPCPPHWGGYRVTPHALEFWQGRRSRLHDRIHYTRVDAGWALARLAP